jgi:hypothetical protein
VIGTDRIGSCKSNYHNYEHESTCLKSEARHFTRELEKYTIKIGGGVVFDIALCDKVWQWLMTYLWFSLGTPVSFTNKNWPLCIAEILLKVALNTITLTLYKLNLSSDDLLDNNYFQSKWATLDLQHLYRATPGVALFFFFISCHRKFHMHWTS